MRIAFSTTREWLFVALVSVTLVGGGVGALIHPSGYPHPLLWAAIGLPAGIAFWI